ncbi:MAG TPA: ABC transporter permease [Candidatus Deferrimicrobiaceae bacterium]
MIRTAKDGAASAAAGGRVLIEPAGRWPMPDFGEVWRYRELLWTLVARDITVRYRQTLLGVAWVVIRPLLGVAIFTVVFGKLARIPSDGYPYPLFVLAALIPWTFFSSTASACGNSLIGSAGLIGKVYFPRLVLPLASAGGPTVDLAVSSLFLVLLLPFFGARPGPGLLALPLLVACLFLFSLGVGTLFSVLIVSYRDFGGLMAFMLQVWMYATPVVYSSTLVPPAWRPLLLLNPLSALVEGFRSAFLGKPFEPGPLAVSASVSVLLFLAAAAVFSKAERRFADVI